MGKGLGPSVLARLDGVYVRRAVRGRGFSSSLSNASTSVSVIVVSCGRNERMSSLSCKMRTLRPGAARGGIKVGAGGSFAFVTGTCGGCACLGKGRPLAGVLLSLVSRRKNASRSPSSTASSNSSKVPAHSLWTKSPGISGLCD